MKRGISTPGGMIPCIFLFLAVFSGAVAAGDWPTYNHDNRRSGTTAEHLPLPLYERWTFRSVHEPAPAWPAPAPRDIWHRLPRLNPRVTYDRAFHVAAVGNSVYFCSSADDKIYSLDAAAGTVAWTFFTGGPVRLAPAVHDGKLYAGSDDGRVYCLDAKKGTLLWRYDPGINERMIPGNQRMISVCPVRTGVLVEDGVAYFCAGLFPTEGVGVFALDAETGREIWKRREENLSPQGYLLAGETRLYVPTGRTTPAAFDRNDGTLIGEFKAPHGDGGSYVLVTRDMLVTGPGKELVAFDPETKEQILTFDGRRMIIAGDMFYLLGEKELSAYSKTRLAAVRRKLKELEALQRQLTDSLKVLKAACEENESTKNRIREITGKIETLPGEISRLRKSGYTWKTGTEHTVSMILAGYVLFCGGDGSVAAYDAGSGEILWEGKVDGRAYGLAAANGRLFVSTDRGTIHCFGGGKPGRPRTIRPRTVPSPFPRDTLSEYYESAAREIAGNLRGRKGYCLVLNCGEGRLMYELSKLTDMHIIGTEHNPGYVRKAREMLDRAGLYGVRASVVETPPDLLPFTDFFANLVVCDRFPEAGGLPSSPDEIYRVLRPDGGLAVIGVPGAASKTFRREDAESWLSGGTAGEWKIVERNGIWITARRGPLPGSGEWTHQYADPGNSASSGDTLVRHPMRIQWFGRPGPRHINDRHHRPMAPLYKDGRVFVIGNNHVVAQDAYNGAILWERHIPGSRRIGVIRDCGHAAASSEHLYIAAEDKCYALDAETGETDRVFRVPPVNGSGTRYWGYVAYTDEPDVLYGSAMKPTAPRTELSYETILEGTYFDNKPIVSSETLFCMDRRDGRLLWKYENGIILNSAIAVGGDHIFFIETTNPAALSDADGRILLTEAFEEGCGHVVKLDRISGKEVWRRDIDFPYEHTVYLSCKGNILLAVGTFNRNGALYYGLYGMDTGTGEIRWRNEYKYGETLNGDHGEQDQHPVIIGNTIYSRPYDFDLTTGEKGTFNLVRGGHGCGTISGSAFYLFGRGWNPRMYAIDSGGETSIVLSRVNRPGCFINMIPAGGLVLLPESSSGCTCAFPVQTSIAYIPER